MKAKWTSSLAIVFSAGVVLAAQTSQAPTTLTGCVYREQDVPGRAPNVAERAWVLDTRSSNVETDRAIGRDRIDLPEFEVASIREATGTCPAKPSGR